MYISLDSNIIVKYAPVVNPLTLKARKYFYTNQETKGFFQFQFEIIINVLVTAIKRILFISVPGPSLYGSTTIKKLSFFQHVQCGDRL